MYEALYRLSRRPFPTTPDPACYVPHESADEALAQLGRCAREGLGVGVLTGAAGLGKTLLCQKLAAELDDDFAVVFLPNANFSTRRSLLQAILYELGHPYTRMGEQELRLELTSAVRGLSGEAAALVLIVDEAHLLGERLLEEIRTLTHLAADGEPLARAVLCGDIALEEKLTTPPLQALNQRVACQVALEPLSLEDSRAYLGERVRWAGAKIEDVFTPDAVRAICRASDGVPRCLNQLGDHCLLLGYLAEEKPIGPDTVREALEDLKQLPLHWNDPGPLPTPTGRSGRETVAEEPVEMAATADGFDDPHATADEPAAASVEVGAAIEVGAVEVGAVEVGAVEVGAVEVGAEPVCIGRECLAGSPWTAEAVTVHETAAWVLSEVVAAVTARHPRAKKPEADAVLLPDQTGWVETERVCRAVYAPEWDFIIETVPDAAISEMLGSPEAALRAEDRGLPLPDPSPFAPEPWPVEWIDWTDDANAADDILPFEPVGEWSSSLDTEPEVPTGVWTVGDEPADVESVSCQPDPRRLLDDVMPLLDELIAIVPFDTESHGSSDRLDPAGLPGRAGDGDDPLPAADDDVWSVPPGFAAVPPAVVSPAADLETQIGLLVLDTSLTTQRELYGQVRNRAADRALAEALQEALQLHSPAAAPAQSTASLEPRDPARRPSGEPYDVVEPVAAPDTAAPAPDVTAPEQRRYGRLFSLLRRRARGEG